MEGLEKDQEHLIKYMWTHYAGMNFYIMFILPIEREFLAFMTYVNKYLDLIFMHVVFWTAKVYKRVLSGQRQFLSCFKLDINLILQRSVAWYQHLGSGVCDSILFVDTLDWYVRSMEEQISRDWEERGYHIGKTEYWHGSRGIYNGRYKLN